MLISEAKKYFKDSKRYKHLIEKLDIYVEVGSSNEAMRLVESLPNEERLTEELVEKLKEKSVYKTLKKIVEGKGDKWDNIKGYSSFLTHAVIECEQGNTEYGMLFNKLYEKLGAALYA